MTIKPLQPLDISIQCYKSEQTQAQRDGVDIGTYPQWRKAKEKQDKFRQELVKARGEDGSSTGAGTGDSGGLLDIGVTGGVAKQEVKPKRKRRTTKKKED